MEMAKERQVAIEKKEKLIQITGGVMAYECYTLDKFVKLASNEEAFELATAFNPDETNLFLWGRCGGGKTHLSTAVVRSQAEKGIRVSRQTVAEFLRNFRALDSPVEQEKISLFVRIPVLVWDDLGRGNISDFGLDVLCEITDKRLLNYRHGLIVTSNFNPDQLVARFHDDRLVSRLIGMCRVVKVEGPQETNGDWRIKLAANLSKKPIPIRDEEKKIR
jgi:DNA replication protein DnaC